MYKRHDAYWRKAKHEGFRSRASFKLQELNRKFAIIKRGKRVIDVGCAPGGWMQVLLSIVGEEGMVVGIDLNDISPFCNENAFFIRGDIREEETQRRISEMVGKADAVVSDVSPDITGVWTMDQYNSYLLSREALHFAVKALREGGHFIVKIFDSPEARKLEKEAQSLFKYVRVFRPKASRKSSAEMYIVCKGLK